MPLHHAPAAAPEDTRSGLGRIRVGASGRTYVTGIADPFFEMCGRRFERSIFVIALE